MNPAQEPVSLEVVVFDVNETLSDLTRLSDRFVSVGLPPGAINTWFAGVLRDGFALTSIGQFRTFHDIAAGNLSGMLNDDQIAHVLAGFQELDTNPDVPDGIRRLTEAGYRLAALTNGATALSESMFERAGILDQFEQRLSVEDVERWKPAPESYRYVSSVCGAPPERMALVAVHPWDIHGAQQVGLVGVWLNRTDETYPPYLPDPDLVVTDLRDLTAALAEQWPPLSR